jgi:hypothetical protein
MSGSEQAQQGVGAATSIINANTHPAGKLDDWRSRVVCLFGLAPNGTPNGYSSSCGAGWTDFKPTSNNPQIDRLPLEATQVPPGISDATVPNPIFNLTPTATVDEGNNWINISWGPLALNGPITGTTLGNYGPAAGSPVINYIPSSASTYAATPPSDFFGIVSRKANNAVDTGAVEFAGGTGGGGGGTGTVSITPNPLTITLPGLSVTGTGVVTLTNTQPTGGASVTVTNVVVPATSAGSGFFTWSLLIDPSGTNANTCTGTTLVPGQTCTVRVRFSSLLATRGVNRLGTITFTDNATGSPQVGQLIGHAN